MEVNKISDIKRYRFVNNVLYSIDSNNNFLINNVLELKGNFSFSGHLPDRIFLFDQNNFETYIYFNLNQVHHIKEYAIIPKYNLENNIYFVGINNGNKLLYGIYNFKINHITQEFNRLNLKGFKFFISSDLYISSTKENIQVNEFKNQKNLWQRTYASLTGVSQNYVSSTILENNGKLYLPISSEGRSGLFVLDIATGEEVAFYENLVFEIAKDGDYIYTSEHKNKFCRIDSKTNEKELYLLNDLLEENGFHSLHHHRFTVKNNILYFTQNRLEVKLGIIDLETKEMLYKHDFAEENGLIGSIEVSNGRVFVHTQDNTLHIFEREG